MISPDIELGLIIHRLLPAALLHLICVSEQHKIMCLIPSHFYASVFPYSITYHIVCFHSAAEGTTTLVIIAVAVVIILVVIVVGVVILVVLFRAKTRKQRLEINKLQKKTEKEMKLKQKETDIDANLSVYQPLYADIQTEASPQVPNHSEELMEYLNQKQHVH